MRPGRSTLAFLTLLIGTACACAHPVADDAHDRWITIHLREGSGPGLLAVQVSYRLEVLESTVHSKDMRDFKVDAVRFGRAFYDEYTRIYGDIIGRNLTVRLNGQLVPLQLRSRSQTTDDNETGKPLGHLRCDFEFTADLLPVRPGADNRLELTEGNFSELDGHHGKIQFAFANQANVSIKRQEVPDPAQEQPLGLGAAHRVTVDFVPTAGNEPTTRPATPPIAPKIEHEPDHADEARHDHDVFLRTFRRLRESEVGLVLMLLIFAGLGAAHALTPGHGKTLVAAYLVGEHGTIWHALLLGLVTTITHTGAVLIIALNLFLLPEAASAHARQAIQTGLGLVLGISVACLGIWLLLQRLSGRADHIHLGGGHDHHHHHTHTAPTGTSPRGLGGIILLGINGGLIPCWDAVAILVAVAGTNEFWLALPALLAFSAGLAGVLVAVGILVVQFRNFAGSKWGEGKIVRVLPLLSAVIVTSMGIYLCYSSMPQAPR